MAIWHKEISIQFLNERGRNTMSEFLGIQFTEIGDDYLTATMPVSERTKQPIGILHGGANVVLAETVASTAANAAIDISRFYCVGLEINANHLRSVTEGLVSATSTPIHLGRSTQVWQVIVCNQEGKPTCISRMTAAVLARE